MSPPHAAVFNSPHASLGRAPINSNSGGGRLSTMRGIIDNEFSGGNNFLGRGGGIGSNGNNAGVLKRPPGGGAAGLNNGIGGFRR